MGVAVELVACSSLADGEGAQHQSRLFEAHPDLKLRGWFESVEVMFERGLLWERAVRSQIGWNVRRIVAGTGDWAREGVNALALFLEKKGRRTQRRVSEGYVFVQCGREKRRESDETRRGRQVLLD